MALTAGLLTFLGVEALAEALELQAALPSALGGPGLVLVGVAGERAGDDVPLVRASRAATGRHDRAGARAARCARDRRAQPRRGARDRDVVCDRRAPARRVPRDRLHDPQRHRRARDRGAREPHAGNARPAGGTGADRRAPPRSSARGSAATRRTTSSPRSSSGSRPAPRSRSSSRWRGTSPRTAPGGLRSGLGDRRLPRRDRRDVGDGPPDRVGPDRASRLACRGFRLRGSRRRLWADSRLDAPRPLRPRDDPGRHDRWG